MHRAAGHLAELHLKKPFARLDGRRDLRNGEAKDHDSRKEDELFSSLKAGDIGIADRAYNCFRALYRQSNRGVFFVVRDGAA